MVLHDGDGLGLCRGSRHELRCWVEWSQDDRSAPPLISLVLILQTDTRTWPMPGMVSSWCSQAVRATSSYSWPVFKPVGRGFLDLRMVVVGACGAFP